MFVEQPPHFLRLIWKGTWRKKQAGKKVVYLTFDDGPSPVTTPKLLDLLDEHAIKATFFCVGDNVRKYPDLFQEIKRRGHQVGNHTMHHLKGFCTDYHTYIRDVTIADKLIQSHLMRPPYGRIKPEQLRTLSKKYEIVMWDVITRDYNNKLTPEEVYTIVKRYTRNGSIIVFHDSETAAQNRFGALPASICFLKEHGYSFELL